MLCSPYSTIDVEMIESVEEVPHDPQTATTESTERFGFNITCTGRTYELQSEDDETRKQSVCVCVCRGPVVGICVCSLCIDSYYV